MHDDIIALMWCLIDEIRQVRTGSGAGGEPTFHVQTGGREYTLRVDRLRDRNYWVAGLRALCRLEPPAAADEEDAAADEEEQEEDMR